MDVNLSKEWLDFVKKGMNLNTMEEAMAFYDLLTTPAERAEIPKRILILEELFKGKLTQNEIAKKLNVSIANVTRGVNTIRLTPYDLRSLFEKLNNKK